MWCRWNPDFAERKRGQWHCSSRTDGDRDERLASLLQTSCHDAFDEGCGRSRREEQHGIDSFAANGGLRCARKSLDRDRLIKDFAPYLEAAPFQRSGKIASHLRSRYVQQRSL